MLSLCMERGVVNAWDFEQNCTNPRTVNMKHIETMDEGTFTKANTEPTQVLKKIATRMPPSKASQTLYRDKTATTIQANPYVDPTE